MSRIKVADFYYGAALSVLFNNSNSKITAALIESDNNRQLYGLTTDKSECRLFIKYRSDKIDTKTEDYYSWLFNLTERDKSEIQALISEGRNLILALVCGVSQLGAIMLLETGNENVKFKTKPDIPDEELPAVSCKRKDMLNLSLEDYKKYRDPIQNACLFKKSIPIQKIVNRHKK